jgi:hypothetical protein
MRMRLWCDVRQREISFTHCLAHKSSRYPDGSIKQKSECSRSVFTTLAELWEDELRRTNVEPMMMRHARSKIYQKQKVEGSKKRLRVFLLFTFLPFFQHLNSTFQILFRNFFTFPSFNSETIKTSRRSGSCRKRRIKNWTNQLKKASILHPFHPLFFSDVSSPDSSINFTWISPTNHLLCTLLHSTPRSSFSVLCLQKYLRQFYIITVSSLTIDAEKSFFTFSNSSKRFSIFFAICITFRKSLQFYLPKLWVMRKCYCLLWEDLFSIWDFSFFRSRT